MRAINSLSAITLPVLACSAAMTAADSGGNQIEEMVVFGTQQPYFEKSRRTSLKMDADDLATPFSTSTINSAILEDLKASSLEDAYSYISGFSRSGTSANSFTIRGHAADLQNMQVDGLPGMVSRFGSPVTANIERVEVLKGPASVLYGWMDPGGMINIITKKPQAEQHTSLFLSAQQFIDTGESGIEGSIDTTGSLGGDDTLLYRFIIGSEQSDSFRDYVDTDTIYAYPSISWLPDDKSRLDVQLEYSKEERSADNGLFVLDNDIDTIADVETYYQEPGGFDNDEGYGLSLAYTREVNDKLNVNIKWRSVWHEDERDLYESNSVQGATLRRRNRHQYNEREYHFLDANLAYRFGENVTHDLLIGINGGYEYRQYDRLAFDTRGANVDIDNPVYTGDILVDDPQSFRNWDLDTAGFYMMDRITFNNHWTALLGVRYDGQSGDYELKYLDRDTTAVADESVSNTSFNGGLVYRINSGLSLYISYAESFNPQAIPKLDANGDQFDPEEGEQFEAGVKFEAADGRLNVNLAYFDVVKSNITEEGVSGNDELVGEVSSNGIELNVQAQPMPNVQLQLGYTYTDAEISKAGAGESPGERLGNPPAFAPKHSAFFLTRYNHPEEIFGGLMGASLGWSYEDERYTDAHADRRVLLPSHSVVDLSIYYEVGSAKYALNIANVTDEEYFVGGRRDTSIYPGEPTKVSLSARFDF